MLLWILLPFALGGVFMPGKASAPQNKPAAPQNKPPALLEHQETPEEAQFTMDVAGEAADEDDVQRKLNKTLVASTPLATLPPPPFDIPGGIVVITNGTLYTPTRINGTSVIIASGKVLSLISDAKVGPLIREFEAANITVKVLNAARGSIVPGFVDVHVHAGGGGGEMGPESRTPPAELSQLARNGLTTIIGLSGTDTVTRGQGDLFQKMQALGKYINTYMWTGGYRSPPRTLTGDVETDIILIDKILGVGEIAISDHRSSWPSKQALLKMISEARVAGLLSGKAGVTHFHVGGSPSGLEPLWEIVNTTSIPITNIYPTHVTRNAALLNDAARWVKAGGNCDFTAATSVNVTFRALATFMNLGVDMSHVSISSDAYGSLPKFDSHGVAIGMDIGSPSILHRTLRHLVLDHGLNLTYALQFITVNPSRILGLPSGHIVPGASGDIVILDDRLEIDYVFARGEMIKHKDWVRKGLMEIVVE